MVKIFLVKIFKNEIPPAFDEILEAPRVCIVDVCLQKQKIVPFMQDPIQIVIRTKQIRKGHWNYYRIHSVSVISRFENCYHTLFRPRYSQWLRDGQLI